MKKFSSKVFQVEEIVIGGTTEHIVRGGRDKFSLLEKAFVGIKQIGVIGWGSQGPAQAQNLRDSLAGTSIKVKVGLQKGSKSLIKAMSAGFTEESGTLGEMFEVIRTSDLVILLISDAAQVENYNEIAAAIRPGAILGLSHGFLLGYLDSRSNDFFGTSMSISVGPRGFSDKHFSVIGVCPKGMGPSVRKLYEQGKEINGAGINCSFAIERDLDGRATDVALAWAIAIGAPYIFQTTLRGEYKSDIFGERGVLLGGVHGMVEALYRSYIEPVCNRHYITDSICSCHIAFRESVEQVTGVISSTISKYGIIGLYDSLPVSRKNIFEKAFHSAFYPYYAILCEIYDEVSSGNEIRSVIMANKRLQEYPMGNIETTDMWEIGKKTRERRKSGDPNFTNQSIDPTTAGIYCAMMMAQVVVLMKNGHCLSEICNETVIEAVDSLNPYMHARGVAYMVDNCSITTRLGTRKWGPRFDHITMQQVIPALNDGNPVDGAWFENFKNHSIHDALAVCATMRPSVDISVA